MNASQPPEIQRTPECAHIAATAMAGDGAAHNDLTCNPTLRGSAGYRQEAGFSRSGVLSLSPAHPGDDAGSSAHDTLLLGAPCTVQCRSFDPLQL